MVVCPDCIGNRSFCLTGENCFRPDYDEDAIVAAAETALRGGAAAWTSCASAALATAAATTSPASARAFLEILDRVERALGGSA